MEARIQKEAFLRNFSLDESEYTIECVTSFIGTPETYFQSTNYQNIASGTGRSFIVVLMSQSPFNVNIDWLIGSGAISTIEGEAFFEGVTLGNSDLPSEYTPTTILSDMSLCVSYNSLRAIEGTHSGFNNTLSIITDYDSLKVDGSVPLCDDTLSLDGTPVNLSLGFSDYTDFVCLNAKAINATVQVSQVVNPAMIQMVMLSKTTGNALVERGGA